MEHEVFVPVPAERLREVLDDPARVARAVPGLQQDAGAEPVTGRLKIRVGSHSVTYRGAVRVSRAEDGAYAVEGDATEARGSGSVKLALRIALRDAEDGTTVVFGGTAAADGRIKDLPSDAVEGAVTRLLNRFAEHLAAAAPETTAPLATQDFEPRATTDHETTPDADDAAPPPPPPAGAEGGVMAEADEEAGVSSAPGHVGEASARGHADDARAPGAGDESSAPGDADEPPAPAADDDAPAPASEPATPAPEPPAVFGSDIPPSSLGPSHEEDEEDEEDEDDEDIAEAAHARRTMIGRSAEEVDHAPPRGRYAPVPAPQTVMPAAPLRWAAPAAALALASAIVAVRALRRRR
ncbi:SRPBCC domain-containing protein [Streptomyces sp. DH10]|uniref:SRPBCC domain-containing protein n=1 Tax=Streptomyces sp. DH10 TaxID=3040121 RepID=UPI0024425908|nr:SRPBCC domain-containing protein [Streptomyces sp. DH10]MDG9712104.1 SRPBCC domain-containing protein [Streptomyces sp. DH10]